MIQNAYQGFAKQNFMMLDNLKLGYGGTAGEMARLINETGVMGSAFVATAENVKSVPFDKMIEAIHQVQVNMGITGTTALEAEKTITGSMSAVTASWQNLLTAMADGNQDIGAIIEVFMGNLTTMLENMLPKIKTVFEKIPTLITELAPFIADAVQTLLPSLLQGATALFVELVKTAPQLASTLIGMLPFFAEQFQTMFTTLSGMLPDMFDITPFLDKMSVFVSNVVGHLFNIGEKAKEKIPEIIAKILPLIQQLSERFLEEAPRLIEAGMRLIANIVQGIIDSLPDLIAYVPTIITNIADTISQGMQIILLKGAEIVWNIIAGIVQSIPDLLANIGNIIDMIFSVWTAINWMNLGKSVFEGIKGVLDNLPQYIDDIFNWIKNSVTNVWNTIRTSTGNIWNNIWGTINNFVTLIQNWIVNGFIKVATTVRDTFINIKNSIMNPIETAVNFVKAMIDKMRSFFNFTWSLPKLKLPHLSITGSFSLMPPSVPKFSIEWYKNGGILNFPTAFGINPASGNIMAGGEAGKEAVAPLDDLMGYVRTAVAEANNSNGMLDVLKAIYTLMSDDDRLREIFTDALLNGNFKVVLDNREVGRIVRTYA